MKSNCDLVKDLLPRYVEGVCSENSRKIIEEHTKECPSCKKLLKSMEINKRKNSERLHIAGKWSAGVLVFVLLICLVVNLATEHTLNWFFIVLASLLVVASLSVVPLLAPRRKGVATLFSFVFTLLLLLFVCCQYNHGDWFFVAAIAVLLGASIVFTPYVLYQYRDRGILKNNKGLISMVTDTILLFGTVWIACGFNISYPDCWKNGFGITMICTIYAWALFFIIRYAKFNGYMKAGICLIISGIFGSVINDMINWIINGTWQLTLTKVNFLSWKDATINANIDIIYLVAGIAAGIYFVLFGVEKSKH